MQRGDAAWIVTLAACCNILTVVHVGPVATVFLVVTDEIGARPAFPLRTVGKGYKIIRGASHVSRAGGAGTAGTIVCHAPGGIDHTRPT